MWSLDKEKTKLKADIHFCKSNLAALDACKKEELKWLAQKYNDVKLLSTQKGQKDYHFSQKLRELWDQEDNRYKELDYSEQQLEMIESEIHYYMHSTL